MIGCVFDFDGVIVRSMELHAEAYRRVLAQQGVPVTDDQVFRMEGARSESIIRELLRGADRPHDEGLVKRLSEEKQRIFLGLGPPEHYAGAEELLRRVRSAVDRMGLVTGTRRVNLERFIPTLLPLFDSTLAQEGYSKDKPDPEPYTRAAEALRLPPANLAALENAPRGVKSAKAAGYAFVVGVTTTMPASALRESGADAVASTHSEAGRFLVKWANGQPGPRSPPGAPGPR